MSRSDQTPRLLFTVGDMNGIGPEVLLKGLSVHAHDFNYEPTIIGSLRLLRRYTTLLPGMDLHVEGSSLVVKGARIPVIDLPTDCELDPGSETSEAGKLAGDSIIEAVKLLLNNRADGLVTMPISKNGLRLGGYDWPGHTEMLADLSGGNRPMMILATEGLRVALMTIHVPLCEVSSHITQELVLERIVTFSSTLNNDFGVDEPSIAVLGLNPHAGEDGTIGTEEKEIILPALDRARNQSYQVDGPFPADGFFARYGPGDYDGVLACYHDQGLIPLKILARGEGVNITAGLPVVRTSPDHGTAFGIAGNDVADASSTLQAIETALMIIGNRRKRKQNLDESGPTDGLQA